MLSFVHSECQPPALIFTSPGGVADPRLRHAMFGVDSKRELAPLSDDAPGRSKGSGLC